MSRIAKSDVNRVLDGVGKRLVEAGGADKRISRADVQKALGGLNGTEKKLVDMFFRFADHRDFKSGAQLTPKDVQRAVAYAKEHMVAKYDLDSNGLSQSEIAKMSTTGKLAVDLAKALKAAPEVSSDGLISEDTTWADLYYRVEITSDYPIWDAKEMYETPKAQIVAALEQLPHAHVTTAAKAFQWVDEGEIQITNFTDPATSKKYTAVTYSAGDNCFGAIFEEGKRTPAHLITDGEIAAAG